MNGIFVNECGCIGYADAIVEGYKTIETRGRNMLRSLVGSRVAIIRTKRGKAPTVIGYANIVRAEFCPVERFDALRDQTLVPPGSRYDATERGKWCYHMTEPERCNPYPLPTDAIRHGRSWCEF